MSVNIGGSANDSSYRYKMPPLVCKVEGRGNGIKTNVVNMLDVAKALHIHPAYPLKFFGIELGAQTKWLPKEEKATVNGAHQAGEFSKLLTKFIDMFILCPQCKLPELKMTIGKDIKIACDACGHSGKIVSVHKLVGYIVKNPPSVIDAVLKDSKLFGAGDDDEENDGEPVKQEKKSKADLKREERKKRKEQKRKSEDGEGDDIMSDEDYAADVVEEKPKKDKKSSKSKSKSKSKASADNAVDEWHTDVSREAQRERKEAELREMHLSKAKGEAIEELEKEHEKSSDNPVAVLKLFLAQNERTAEQVYGEVKRVAMARGLDDANRFKVLLETIFDPSQPRAAVSTMEKYCRSVKKLIGGNTQQASTFLHVLEEFVGVTASSIMPFIGHLLKLLYESDALEDDDIISWYDSPLEDSFLANKDIARSVREKAKPVVEWLKDDEDEDEE